MRRATTKSAVRSSVATVATLAVALSGCVATTEQSVERSVVVGRPPPDPMQETRTQPPSQDSQWLAGYWHWNGTGYSWVPGHWESAQRGLVWNAPRYFQSGGNQLYSPGRWTPVPQRP